MSNLLNEAIIDAKALKEAALKNAEAAVIKKYSAEVKQTLDTLLEQEDAAPMGAAPEGAPADLGAEPAPEADPMADLGMEPELGGEEDLGMAPAGEEQADIAPDVPLAAADGIGSAAAEEGTPVEFNVDLQALQEAVAALENELSEDEEIEINEIDLAALLEDDEVEISEADADDPDAGDQLEEDADTVAYDSETDTKDPSAEETEADSDAMDRAGLEEDVDSLVDAIMEKLTVDMGADLAGWAGRSSEDIKYQMEKEMAHRRSTDVAEEMKDLKKAQEELVFENNHLNEKLSNYEQAVGQLKENLQQVNLSNARLLYTNRILRNTSLNERQKNKVVEAISNAGSVTEARTIFDTLQSTVESTPKRGPQSLGEAITRRSSVIRASRHESTPSDPISDRLKKLAGIN
jgi:hypothetical protein